MSLSSFAINRNADDHAHEFPGDVIEAIRRAYVDDVPTSAPSESSLAALIQGLIDLCKLGGFPLTKFVSLYVTPKYNNNRLLIKYCYALIEIIYHQDGLISLFSGTNN